jgi:hypothetical protein
VAARNSATVPAKNSATVPAKCFVKQGPGSASPFEREHERKTGG